MRKLLFRTAAAALLTGFMSVGTAQASTRVYVRLGPPPIVVEHRPQAPRGHYLWRPGYHRYVGHRYVWTSGAWVRPPYQRARWVSGRWQHEHRGYYWVPGHWAR